MTDKENWKSIVWKASEASKTNPNIAQEYVGI